MDDIKKVLLETLCEFHALCEEHQLEYFLIGGTLLGAVRNQGFIPWDDDIDVAMPRKDYNKLISLGCFFKHPLKLRTHKSEKNHPFPFIKLTNEQIIVREMMHTPIVSGVWVDVFPLDYTFSSGWLQKLQLYIARCLRFMLSTKCYLINFNKYHPVKKVIAITIYHFARLTPRSMLNFLFTFNERAPAIVFRRRENIINLYGAWGVKETAPMDIFSTKKLYSFEGKEFWGPANADFWLKKVYGNYMQLPPKEKRQSHHKIEVLTDK